MVGEEEEGESFVAVLVGGFWFGVGAPVSSCPDGNGTEGKTVWCLGSTPSRISLQLCQPLDWGSVEGGRKGGREGGGRKGGREEGREGGTKGREREERKRKRRMKEEKYRLEGGGGKRGREEREGGRKRSKEEGGGKRGDIMYNQCYSGVSGL